MMAYSTRTRSALLDILESHKDTSISAEEVLDALRQRGLEVNKTTVYRNLERMVEDGSVHKFSSEDGKRAFYQLSEGTCSDHLHLQCSVCGKVEHLDCDFMKSFEEHVRREHGFSLSCKGSIIYGVCKACQGKS